MQSLITECWEHFHNITNNKSIPIVKASIPILYFGNKKKYDQSGLKVITVALNPSYAEFPKADRYQRFRGSENFSKISEWSKTRSNEYLKVLNKYFHKSSTPYTRWFNSLEPILYGLDCTFYQKPLPFTALHTDLCSPLATETTWSNLNGYQKNILGIHGRRIWHKLVSILEPDVVLLSVARKYLEKIRFRKINSWEELIKFTTDKIGNSRNPYSVLTTRIKLERKDSLLVFGRAANVPFGLITNQQKLEIGRALLKQLDI